MQAAAGLAGRMAPALPSTAAMRGGFARMLHRIGTRARLGAMQGDAEVLELLNQVLTGELTAINQYFVHAKLQQNWGYAQLASHSRDESIEEMRHAESLVERIVFLDGLPNVQRLGAISVGETVPEQLQLDLALELAALELLRSGIALAESKGDYVSRELLTSIQRSEEAHVDWIETQVGLIAALGETAYLAEQL